MTNVHGGTPLHTTPGPATDPALQSADAHAQPIRRGSVWIARAVSYLVYAYVLAVEAILLLGFTLLLFGANPSSSFVEWAYRNLDRAMRPFRGIFAPVEIGIAGNDVLAIFDTSIIFAMIIYAVVAIAVGALIAWLTSRINRIDRKVALEVERDQHARELQVLRDRANVAEAQRAATNVAATEWTAAQRAAANVAAGEWEAAQRTDAGLAPPPSAPGA